MTPGRNYPRDLKPVENNGGMLNQMESYKLSAGLLNVNLLHNGTLVPQNTLTSVGNRHQRSPRHHYQQQQGYQHLTSDYQRKSTRPRLTYTRWNMMISSRYKTELCRQFDEEGFCHFDDKCLFAHGRAELRPLPRHPKYKTELCRDFHDTGFCSFGPRCNFIHSSAEDLNASSQHQQSFFSSSTLARLGLVATQNSTPSPSPPASDMDNSELSDAPFVDFLANESAKLGLFGAIGETKTTAKEDSSSDSDVDSSLKNFSFL